MDTIRIEHGRTLMVAHRGVSGLERENTCAAFVAAGNRSYFGIETDVHRTLDGHFVVIHDSNTGRVAIDELTVEKSTLMAIQSLVLKDMDGQRGRIDLRIPTLQDYVLLCKKYAKVGVLELKNEFTREELEQIVAIIREQDYLSGIIFISFPLMNLVTLREMLPEQPMQYLISSFPDDLIDTLKAHSLDLDIHYKALTRERLEALHAAGIKVNAWTVDDPADAAQLVDWGIDYITSNILE